MNAVPNERDLHTLFEVHNEHEAAESESVVSVSSGGESSRTQASNNSAVTETTVLDVTEEKRSMDRVSEQGGDKEDSDSGQSG